MHSVVRRIRIVPLLVLFLFPWALQAAEIELEWSSGPNVIGAAVEGANGQPALAPGDTLVIKGHADPYRQLTEVTFPSGSVSGGKITVRGVPGPNGEPVVISGAYEANDSSYWRMVTPANQPGFDPALEGYVWEYTGPNSHCVNNVYIDSESLTLAESHIALEDSNPSPGNDDFYNGDPNHLTDARQWTRRRDAGGGCQIAPGNPGAPEIFVRPGGERYDPPTEAGVVELSVVSDLFKVNPDVNYVVVEDITLENANYPIFVEGDYFEGRGLTLRGSFEDAFKVSADLAKPSQPAFDSEVGLLENCNIYNHGEDGIDITGGDFWAVRNCAIHDNFPVRDEPNTPNGFAGTGILVKNKSLLVVVEGNRLFDLEHRFGAISIGGNSRFAHAFDTPIAGLVTVRNNIVDNVRGAVIFTFAGAHHSSVINNVVVNSEILDEPYSPRFDALVGFDKGRGNDPNREIQSEDNRVSNNVFRDNIAPRNYYERQVGQCKLPQNQLQPCDNNYGLIIGHNLVEYTQTVQVEGVPITTDRESCFSAEGAFSGVHTCVDQADFAGDFASVSYPGHVPPLVTMYGEGSGETRSDAFFGEPAGDPSLLYRLRAPVLPETSLPGINDGVEVPIFLGPAEYDLYGVPRMVADGRERGALENTAEMEISDGEGNVDHWFDGSGNNGCAALEANDAKTGRESIKITGPDCELSGTSQNDVPYHDQFGTIVRWKGRSGQPHQFRWNVDIEAGGQNGTVVPVTIRFEGTAASTQCLNGQSAMIEPLASALVVLDPAATPSPHDGQWHAYRANLQRIARKCFVFSKLRNLNNFSVVGANGSGGEVWVDDVFVSGAIPNSTGAWPLEEARGLKAEDVACNGDVCRPATLTGLATSPPRASAWIPASKGGHALAFNGVNNAGVEAGNNGAGFSRGMTVAMWVRPNSVSSGTATPLAAGLTGDPGSRIEQVDQKLIVTLEAGGPVMGELDGLLEAGVWQHIVVTADPDNQNTTFRRFQFYADGVLKGVDDIMAQASLDALYGLNDKTVIGNDTAGGPSFNGAIADFRIYDRVLLPEEINELAKP
ncbi:MAG: LamG-like jellyroll fold domain-containing protein [Myxococcota bacterium]